VLEWWSVGVLVCWSAGVSGRACAALIPLFSFPSFRRARGGWISSHLFLHDREVFYRESLRRLHLLLLIQQAHVGNFFDAEGDTADVYETARHVLVHYHAHDFLERFFSRLGLVFFLGGRGVELDRLIVAVFEAKQHMYFHGKPRFIGR
jgi:hypothetical protein